MIAESHGIVITETAASRSAAGPIRWSSEASTATIMVRDGGMGIRPDDLDLRALRTRGLNAHYGGLGIGLYLVRTLVEAHGGSVAAHSWPGHGATFIVTLSRAEVS